MAGRETQEARETLVERLTAWADLCDKSVEFMADPEMVAEALAEVALLREAVVDLARLAAAEEALRTVRRRLWWFIEQDHGDGNEVGAAEVCAEAMDIQHNVIDPALAASRKELPCGHPLSAVVTDSDLGYPGTSYCGACAESDRKEQSDG